MKVNTRVRSACQATAIAIDAGRRRFAAGSFANPLWPRHEQRKRAQRIADRSGYRWWRRWKRARESSHSAGAAYAPCQLVVELVAQVRCGTEDVRRQHRDGRLMRVRSAVVALVSVLAIAT